MRSVPDITSGPYGYRVWFAGQVAHFATLTNAARYAAWLRAPSGDNDNRQPMEKLHEQLRHSEGRSHP